MDRKESSKKPLSLDLQFSVIRFAIFGDSLYCGMVWTPLTNLLKIWLDIFSVCKENCVQYWEARGDWFSALFVVFQRYLEKVFLRDGTESRPAADKC
jgi:hypothetical protein